MSQSVTLSTSGQKMPLLGMGTSHQGAKAKEEMERAVRFAILNGYRHIDGAHFYLNEEKLGRVYSSVIHGGKESEEGKVRRQDLFIASKLWNTHHDPRHVEEALQTTLKALKVDYLDLYYIHWPSAFEHGSGNLPKDPKTGRLLQLDVDYVDTWRAMEDLMDRGLVRNLGVCNFNCQQLKRLLSSCRIRPAALQIESNPRMHNEILRQLCQKHSIAMVGFSPFGSPDLPGGAESHLPPILRDPLLQRISSKHGRSVAQVALRWQIQRGVSVIPKSVIESELLDNLKIYEFELAEEDMEQIATLDRKFRRIFPMVKLANGELEPRDLHSKYFPFHHEETESCLE